MAEHIVIHRANLHDVRKQISGILNDLEGRIDDLDEYAVGAAYGGVRLATPIDPPDIPDIGAGWVTIQADSGVLVTPKWIVQDFANNGIRFEIAGIFSISVNITAARTLS